MSGFWIMLGLFAVATSIYDGLTRVANAMLKARAQGRGHDD